jgi:hypothetical protein
MGLDLNPLPPALRESTISSASCPLSAYKILMEDFVAKTFKEAHSMGN